MGVLAVGGGESALAVVADVGGALGGAGLVAHDRLVQGDQQRGGVLAVELRLAERPGGAAHDRAEVVGETGGDAGQRAREVELEGAAVGADGGRDGAVVVVALGQAEGGLRDRGLAAAGRGPAHVEVGAAVVLEVLDLDVDGVTGGQIDGLAGLLLVPVVDPVVDDEMAVHPEAEAVVADDREGGGAGLLGDETAGPASADIVVLTRRGTQPGFEVGEVESGVEGGRLEGGEVEGALGGLGVVLALEAVGLGWAVGGRPGAVVGGNGGGRAGRGREARGGHGRGEEQGETVSEASGAHGSSVGEDGWRIRLEGGSLVRGGGLVGGRQGWVASDYNVVRGRAEA